MYANKQPISIKLISPNKRIIKKIRLPDQINTTNLNKTLLFFPYPFITQQQHREPTKKMP